MEAGANAPLGATVDADGVNFALFSSVAEQVELCLFDERGRETGRYSLPQKTGDVWHGYLPNCRPGQRYGYRVHGSYEPDRGLRCNPAKLLIDPYARLIDGEFVWHDAVFDYRRDPNPNPNPNPNPRVGRLSHSHRSHHHQVHPCPRRQIQRTYPTLPHSQVPYHHQRLKVCLKTNSQMTLTWTLT